MPKSLTINSWRSYGNGAINFAKNLAKKQTNKSNVRKQSQNYDSNPKEDQDEKLANPDPFVSFIYLNRWMQDTTNLLLVESLPSIFGSHYVSSIITISFPAADA